jgi:hypothetical protein
VDDAQLKRRAWAGMVAWIGPSSAEDVAALAGRGQKRPA